MSFVASVSRARRRPARVTRFLVIAILCLVPLLCSAGPFQDGAKAYQAGDFSGAFQHWLPLAKEGYPVPQVLIGSLYAYGQGVERDDARAAMWFRRAAQQGSAQGQYNLGIMYEQGWGVPQDRDQAAHWYSLAAGQGRQDAREKLAALNQRPTATGESPDPAPSTAGKVVEPVSPVAGAVGDKVADTAPDSGGNDTEARVEKAAATAPASIATSASPTVSRPSDMRPAPTAETRTTVSSVPERGPATEPVAAAAPATPATTTGTTAVSTTASPTSTPQPRPAATPSAAGAPEVSWGWGEETGEGDDVAQPEPGPDIAAARTASAGTTLPAQAATAADTDTLAVLAEDDEEIISPDESGDTATTALPDPVDLLSRFFSDLVTLPKAIGDAITGEGESDEAFADDSAAPWHEEDDVSVDPAPDTSAGTDDAQEQQDVTVPDDEQRSAGVTPEATGKVSPVPPSSRQPPPDEAGGFHRTWDGRSTITVYPRGQSTQGASGAADQDQESETN